MSDVPPNVVGSAAQAGYHQADVARANDARRAEQQRAGQTSAKAITEAGDTIETSDNDTAVYADAEGTGGQGRYTEEESNENSSATEEQASDQGVSKGEDGQPHVDLQA